MENLKNKKFGTFGGVFIPNVLTILGIILFMRLGWVVGQAGLINAFIIIGIANLITLLTSFSLSSISTNIKVKTGGAYYIISRSLGLPIGGAIGIPLYFSQAISVAFYLIGFSEIFYVFFPSINPQIVALIICFLFAGIAYLGADFVIKIQYFIALVLTLAIASFFVGSNIDSSSELVLSSTYQDGYGFWTVFAVFFPAVTGIMSGVSMSGDLKDPARSIPKGTIIAVVFTAIIYFIAVYLLATRASVKELLTNVLILKKVSLVPVLFTAGVWAATLSSALTSIISAPRTLQAIAKDRVVPAFFGKKLGSSSEPRFAVIVTFLVATGVIMIGNLNLIAPIISMFFLNTYGMINLSAGIESLLGNPNFRPSMKTHWSLSILGGIGCYGAMFLINPIATIIAIFVSLLIFVSIKKKQLSQTWGDSRSGIWFWIAQYALTRLETAPDHIKNWKPNIMAFVANPVNQHPLIQLSHWLSKGKGLISLHRIITVGNSAEQSLHLRSVAKVQLEKFIKESEIPAFAECSIAKDFLSGVKTQLMSYGIGRMRPNTILMGWGDNVAGRALLIKGVTMATQYGMNSLILKVFSFEESDNKKSIDVWWGGKGGNGSLMLMLAYLMTLNPYWQNCDLRLLRIIDETDGVVPAERNIKKDLLNARIDGVVKVIANDKKEEISSIVHRYSNETDFTLIGTGIPLENKISEYAERIEKLISPLKNVLIIHSADKENIIE